MGGTGDWILAAGLFVGVCATFYWQFLLIGAAIVLVWLLVRRPADVD